MPVPAPPLPATLDTVGGWRIRHTLGSGGMGVVYLAASPTTGEQVALKTVQTPAASQLDAIRREIAVLRRLSHPGVVRVVDAGVHDGAPWYAMEVLTGLTLRSWLAIGSAEASHVVEPTITMAYDDVPMDVEPTVGTRRAGLAPARWPDTLRTLSALCHALAYLHGEGIVHRDLKPDNVFCREDGTPVIVDFGLFRSFAGADGREALDADGASGLGTLAYVAPEQLRGELVDARADLYALGCILYEAAVGRPPFVGARDRVAWQHLHAEPPPPSSLADGLPDGLDALVAKLLAKSPHDRIGYASDVAAALERLAPAGQPSPADHPVCRPYLYRPPLVSRAEALDALAHTLPERGARGMVSIVAGPSGVGKTRLAIEVARRATDRRAHVARGECPALRLVDTEDLSTRAGPLHPLRPLLLQIGDYCRSAGPEETERVLGERAALLSRYEPSLASLSAAQPPLPLQRAASARERLFHWLADTISAFAARHPTLILLDDLQWADELTIAFIEAIATGTVQIDSAQVVATVRAESAAQIPAWLEHPGVRTLWLDPLGLPAVERLIADTLAVHNPPASLVRRAAETTGGNPFYVNEYLHALLASGGLVRHDGRWRLADGADLDALPTTLPDLLAARYASLDPSAQLLIDAMSVFGSEADLALLGAVTERDDDEVLRLLGTLLVRNMLEETAPGRFHLAHGRIGEAAYARIPPEARKDWHRRVATALLGASSADPVVLAHHFARADEHREAYRWLTTGAHQSWQAGAATETRRMLDEAFALERSTGVGSSLSTDERAHLDLLHARALHAVGELSAAHASAASTLRRLGYRVPRGRLGWFTRLLWEVARLLAGPGRTSAPDRYVVPALALTMIERVSLVTGDTLVMLAAGTMGANAAYRAGPRAPVAHAFTTLSATFGMLGIDRVYQRLLARGREVALQSGADLQLVALAETFVSSVRGRWERAEEAAAEGFEAAHRAGDYYTHTQIELALGVGRLMRGDLPGLVEIAQRVDERARRGGYGVERMYALLLRAGAAWSIGDTDACLLHLDEVEPLCTSVGEPGGLTTLYATRACALAAAGSADDARACADHALVTLRAASTRNPTFSVPFSRLPWAYLRLWELGDRGPTQATPSPLRAARELLTGLKGQARLQTPARTTLHRLHGDLTAAEGRTDLARTHLERGLQSATALAQPFERGLIHWSLARIAPDPSTRAIHEQQARDLLSTLGSTLPPLGVRA